MPAINIPYQLNGIEYFKMVRHLEAPVLLDSGCPSSLGGRYDIITAAPVTTLTSENGFTRIVSPTGIQTTRENPLDVARQLLRSRNSAAGQLPFCSGMIFTCSYDFGRYIEKLPQHASQDIPFPEFFAGIYDWAIVLDHHKKEGWLSWREGTNKPDINFTNKPQPAVFKLKGLFRADMGRNHYLAAFKTIQEYINAGDIYQVNLGQRFSSYFEGDPLTAYESLRETVPTPHSAYLEFNGFTLLSHSPERFIRVNPQGEVETRPIKGTRPRGLSSNEDRMLADELRSSSKDRAENLMIVDLLRNDLGRSCKAGSISVDALFAVESYPNVHHLVSTITGSLKDDQELTELLKHAFPGGSITGAPKVRAMEIIDELEQTRRAIYCGSIGYISDDGHMDSSITIRTLLCHKSQIYCWGGGGIVADSDAEQEYQESITKVQRLMDTLENASGIGRPKACPDQT